MGSGYAEKSWESRWTFVGRDNKICAGIRNELDRMRKRDESKMVSKLLTWTERMDLPLFGEKEDGGCVGLEGR